MNIYVLLKRTFDTEEKIFVSGGRVQEEEAAFIINPYDEYAIEEALQLREKHGGEVTVITAGNEDCEKQLRTALALGADKAVLLDVEDEIKEGDQFTAAKVLAHYLTDKKADLILAGNMAIDGGSGQVGPRVAEELGIPCATAIIALEISGQTALITRDVEGDTETVSMALPVLVTCQQGLNDPRYPSLPGIMKAKKKPLEKWEFDDLTLQEDDVNPKTKTLSIFMPQGKSAGKILEGELPDQAAELVRLLRSEAKVI